MGKSRRRLAGFGQMSMCYFDGPGKAHFALKANRVTVTSADRLAALPGSEGRRATPSARVRTAGSEPLFQCLILRPNDFHRVSAPPSAPGNKQVKLGLLLRHRNPIAQGISF